MEMDLARRLNLITGDNGLGKSFLLDVAWWALTRRWPQEMNSHLTSGYVARPTDPKKPASIEFKIDSKTKSVAYTSHYVARDQGWLGKAGRPWNPGLVIYAHVDGGFSVWDPARNYWKKKGNIDVQDRLPAYIFSPKEVWDGLKVENDGRETLVCQGLLADWANWIREDGQAANNMAEVLNKLSPPGDGSDRLVPGPLTRISIDDARDIPTLRTGYSDSVPILYASSGVRRIVALAYMLLWSWEEHALAAELIGETQTSQVIFLIDELESHLHPRWQRSILKSVMNLVSAMHHQASAQIIAATHSPLVLVSAEPLFDPDQDAWFDLDLNGDRVELRLRDFQRLGDVSNWLKSEAFDLKEARSLEAENAITEALSLLKNARPKKREIEHVTRLLRDSLNELDRFWVRWSEFAKNHKVDV